jgi:homoserine dehydrogenase
MGSIQGRYYLRFTTLDRPGVLGKICTILGSHGVSIASCIQKEEHEVNRVHVILMTYATLESALCTALAEIDALEVIHEPTHFLRVLDE